MSYRIIAATGTPFTLAAGLLLCPCFCASAAPAPVRERISLDANWSFHRDDPGDGGDDLQYSKIKNWVLPTGKEFTTNQELLAKEPPADGSSLPRPSFAVPDFDDSQWRHLDLPHDWGVEGPFKQEYPGETGKLPWWGVAWYRKHLKLGPADRDRRIFLDIDGAMAYAMVWVNGEFAGGWPYGYASWQVELTSHLKVGADNVIAIRLDNPKDSSRWYPGGGIYRNVWLEKTEPVHIHHWGVVVTTPQITDDHAVVSIKAEVDNQSPHEAAVVARVIIRELKTLDNGLEVQAGRSVAHSSSAPFSIPAGSNGSSEVTLKLDHPRLWDVDHPHLYEASITLEQNGKVVDRCETPFGVRIIQFTADNGFLLTGKRVPLNGVCDHHDLGPLGAALNVRALQRQLEILREMGCNAIRTSHNPPAPELLDLADRMGILIMDESFDCWERAKKKNDYHLLFKDWHEKDWRAELRRDRNHPSIVLWSIGNEIPEQASPRGLELAAELTQIAREEDATRPATAACDNPKSGYSGFQNIVGVFGYNYKPFLYGKFHAANPKVPLFGSETASCVSSRGEYFFPISTNKLEGKADFQVSSYDLYAPRWATTPEAEFRGQDEFPFTVGEFVWTGFDYLGEPTPYNNDYTNLPTFTDPAQRQKMEKELQDTGKILTPSRSSYFGIVDLDGFKKDRFYLYQARWRPDFPMAHILPHWTWPDRVGQVTPVHVYTSGDEAELFFNGKSLGRKQKAQYEYRLQWDDVVYEPGVLKVVAYKNGKKWATDTVETAGRPAKLELTADHQTISADGEDLSFVTVKVLDGKGLMAPRASNRIHFEIEGPGEIVATDNGDPTNLEVFHSSERNAFNGLCLVIVRSKPGQHGSISLRAESEGVHSASIKIHTRASRARADAR
ncbi:MAG TPA: beta-galactosidase GalB [Candidatus Saccharimonadales bacterium]|nr:beta-galactosidase GalB [Candidatus Saccharimonadales bacterium]